MCPRLPRPLSNVSLSSAICSFVSVRLGDKKTILFQRLTNPAAVSADVAGGAEELCFFFLLSDGAP